MIQQIERATFAGGCGRALERAFRNRAGVLATISGQIRSSSCVSATRPLHSIEAVHVVFDPRAVSYCTLLDWFWSAHDPSANARIAFPSPQYGSIVFAHNSRQRSETHAHRANIESQSTHEIATDVIFHGWELWPEAEVDVDEQLSHETQLWLSRLDARLRPRLGPCIVDLLFDLRCWLGNDDTLLHWVIDRLECELASGGRAAEADDVRVAVVTNKPAASQVEYRTYLPGREVDLAINLAPGDGFTYQDAGCYSYSERVLQRFTFRGQEYRQQSADTTIDREWPASDHETTSPQDAPPHVDAAAAWHEFVPDVAVDLHLEGGHHRIRWSRGALELCDHEADEAELERALASIAGADLSLLELDRSGGKPCGCLAVSAAWSHPWVSSIPSLVGWRGVASKMQVLEEWLCGLHEPVGSSSIHWLAAQASVQRLQVAAGRGPANRPEVMAYRLALSRDHIIELLPPAFRARWVLNHLVVLREQWDTLSHDDQTTVEAVAFGPLRRAVLRSLWQWCRVDSAIDRATIECRFLSHGEQPFALGNIDGSCARIHVATPFDWLTRVWVKGLAVVDRQLILAMTWQEGREAEAIAAAWSEQSTVTTGPLSVRWERGRWRLT